MAHLMGGDAKHRLLFEILNTAYRFGEPHEDGSVFVPITEVDLARQSGLARETVNRSMQSLKASGLLAVNRSGLTVKSIKQLEQLLGKTV
jgi:CRP-like cAMP-binding protein